MATIEALTAGNLRTLKPIAGSAAVLIGVLADRPGVLRRSDRDWAGLAGTTAAHAALVRAFLLDQGLATLGPAPQATAAPTALRALAARLRGLADAAELDVGGPEAEAVVTLPSGSRLEAALADRLDAHATRDGFAHVAAHASRRLALLVPFGDAEGAAFLGHMLASCPAPVRRVYVRPDSKGRRWYEPYRSMIADRGGDLVEYWIPSASGRAETFHAKLALADDRLAYVGSSNLMSASLAGSLECGVILRGELVRPWVTLFDALEQTCGRV